MQRSVTSSLSQRLIRGARFVGHALKGTVLRDEFHLGIARWMAVRGDETLWLDYPLTADSVVFDLGAYHGEFADAIWRRYHCKVYAFEPVVDHFRQCAAAFTGNPDIVCVNSALSCYDGEAYISDEEVGSSIVKAVGRGEKVRVQKFSSVVAEHGIRTIDLLKINIEGGEYDLLPHLVAENIVGKVRFLQIQFHNFVDGAAEKRKQIRDQLRLTHEESWCYPFVWESWRRREP